MYNMSTAWWIAVAIALHIVLAASGDSVRELLVGGDGRWVANPAEPYNRWAERNYFNVGDTLVFRYKGDSVLQVSQSHYDDCNTTDPFLRRESLGDGRSRFILMSSGAYFFISGNTTRCHDGERLIVVVVAAATGNAPGSNTAASAPPSSPTSTSFLFLVIGGLIMVMV